MEVYMKNKWRASVLAAFAVLSFVGFSACDGCSCNGDNSDGAQSSSQSDVNPVKKTDEEIFADVKAGMENTAVYNGVYTVKATSSWNFKEDGEEDVGEGEAITSFDPSTNRAVNKRTEEDGSIATSKVFEKEGKFYYFDYDNRGGYPFGGHAYVAYFEIEESELEEYVDRVATYYGEVPNEVAQECNAFALAGDYGEFVAAFETVTQSSLSQMEEGFSGSVVVSTKHENDMDYVYVTTQGQGTDGNISQSNLYYAVKGGKLAQIYFEGTGVSNGGEFVAKAMWEYSYAFDEELYNSVTEDGFELETKEESTYVYMNFVLTDEMTVTGSARIDENANGQSLFDEMAEETEREYCYYYGKEEVQAATIDGWYLDKQCTQKLNVSTLTVESLLEIEKVYAKSYTLNDGYAMCAYKSSTEDKRTTPYKIVENIIALFSGGQRADGTHKEGIRLAGESITLSHEYCDEILINGVPTQVDSFTLQGGQIYIIETCYYSEDEDINVFNDMFAIFN